MDIQTRKLNLIRYLINLKDESLLNYIETTIQSMEDADDNFIKQMTKAELIDRAQKSENDYVEGRTILQDELEKTSDNW